MSNALANPRLPIKTYSQLRKAVRNTIARGKVRAQRAVEREKVRTAWETGRLIHEHILQNRTRAGYGAQVLKRLSKDLLISQAELSYMIQFARDYPIFPSTDKLPWGHYRELLGINDLSRRGVLIKKSLAGAWTQRQLRRAIRKLKHPYPRVIRSALLDIQEPKIGKPGTYRVVKATVGPYKGKAVVDLGFSNYYRPARMKGKVGNLIRVKSRSFVAPPKGGTPQDDGDLYTYRAWVRKVIDGDTFWAEVDLGFGTTTTQRLRFRNINAEELPSRAGVRAKKYLSKILGRARGGHVLIKTSKSDQYDRYLADVFLARTPTALYVNREMVRAGHAVGIGS